MYGNPKKKNLHYVTTNFHPNLVVRDRKLSLMWTEVVTSELCVNHGV